MKINIFANAHSTQANECTSSLFWEAVNQPSTKSIIEAVREQLAQGNKDAAATLKRSLPAISWQGHSLNGRRGNQFTEPSGLYMLDIDHIASTADSTGNPALIEGTRVAQLAQGDNPWGIVLVHITPSGQALPSTISNRALSSVTPAARILEAKRVKYSSELLGQISGRNSAKGFITFA